MAVTWKKLAYAGDVVAKADYDAYSILRADSDNTPTVLTVAASTIVGRKSTDGIVALSAAEALTILNVEAGADVTDATNVAAAGAVMESDFTAAGMLVVGSGSGTATTLAKGTGLQILRVNTGATALEWATQAASGTDFVVQAVANEAAVSAYATPVVGKILFATSELTFHICTVAV
jgi:hypothetical protein